MIAGAFQVIYMICATMAQWFLDVGTSFFNGIGTWMQGWFA